MTAISALLLIQSYLLTVDSKKRPRKSTFSKVEMARYSTSVKLRYNTLKKIRKTETIISFSVSLRMTTPTSSQTALCEANSKR